MYFNIYKQMYFHNYKPCIFTTTSHCVFTTTSQCIFTNTSQHVFTTTSQCTFTTTSQCTITTTSQCTFTTTSQYIFTVISSPYLNPSLLFNMPFTYAPRQNSSSTNTVLKPHIIPFIKVPKRQALYLAMLAFGKFFETFKLSPKF